LENLNSWTDRILKLENKYEKIMQHNNDINSDLNNIANYTIPTITTTLTGIKKIIITNDDKLNKIETKLKHRIQRQQREIDNLYMIINTLNQFQNNPVTPSDLRRKKKKKGHTSDEEKFETQDNDSNSQMSENTQDTTENKLDIANQETPQTLQLQPSDTPQMSPIDNSNNEYEEEQQFSLESLNQTETNNSRQDSILNYSHDIEFSQISQNKSLQMTPRNLNSIQFPTLDNDTIHSQTSIQDLDNLEPGQDT
jgi:hypothetical protein